MRIATLMWYDEPIKDYSDFAYEINFKYCKKFKIDIIRSHLPRYKDKRHPAWERLPLILENINHYDYLIWIDSDAYFRDSIDIRKFILDHKNSDFIFSEENKHIYNSKLDTFKINTGIIIIKCSNYSKKFIEEWAYNSYLYNHNPYPILWEQGVLIGMLRNNIMNIQEFSTILPYGTIQEIGTTSNSLIHHLAGMSKKDRINILKNAASHINF